MNEAICPVHQGLLSGAIAQIGVARRERVKDVVKRKKDAAVFMEATRRKFLWPKCHENLEGTQKVEKHMWTDNMTRLIESIEVFEPRQKQPLLLLFTVPYWPPPSPPKKSLVLRGLNGFQCRNII